MSIWYDSGLWIFEGIDWTVSASNFDAGFQEAMHFLMVYNQDK